MVNLIRTIVCYLCAVICACSLAFAEGQKKMAFVQTGKNLYQNGTFQILSTRLGVLLTWTKDFLPFAAYNPEQMPDKTENIFVNYKEGKFTAVTTQKASFNIKSQLFLEGPSNSKIQILKSLIFILLGDNSLVILTRGKLIAHVVDQELIKIFLNLNDIKKYGIYSIKNGTEVFLANTKIAPNTTLGVDVQTYNPECNFKLILTESEQNELRKLAPVAAKKYLERIKSDQSNQYRLDPIFWLTDKRGIDISNLNLVNLITDPKYCLLKTTKIQ